MKYGFTNHNMLRFIPPILREAPKCSLFDQHPKSNPQFVNLVEILGLI